MFDGIRKHQKLLQFALLLLILPAFVFLGVSGYQTDEKDPGVAKVGTTTITTREYNAALQQQLDQVRQAMGEQADMSKVDTPEARKQLLDNIISRKVLEQHASESNVSVSRKAVFDALNSNPMLKKDDGTFDEVRYKALIQAQGQTPEVFEAQISKDMASRLMIEALAQSAISSSAISSKVAALTEQVRVAKALNFKTTEFLAKAQPTDEQVKTYYDKNQAQFKTEESAKVEYLVLNADALAGQIALNPDDLRTYYEQNKQRFGTKEQRRASHIFFTASKTASESVKKAAKAGAEAALLAVQKEPAKFAEIARSRSQDAGSAEKGGDLGFFAKDGLVQAVADAAWVLKEGEISGLVESEDGYHVVKLTGIKPGDVKPFDAVKAEAEAELKRQQATKKFSESVEGFTNSVYEQADSLKGAADKFKLVIQTAQGLSRDAPQPGAGVVLSNAKLLKAIFSDDALVKKRNTEAIEVTPGTLVSARVIEYTPAATKPLDQVKANVVQILQAEQAKKEAVTQGEVALKALQGGGPANQFTDPALTISRMTPSNLGRESVEAIFRANEAKLPAYVGVATESGYTVFMVTEVKAGEGKEVDARKPQLQGQVNGLFQQQEFLAFTDNLKNRFKITRNEALILKQDK
jgi:peptidyl-prolyl cis-trans isomerase D